MSLSKSLVALYFITKINKLASFSLKKLGPIFMLSVELLTQRNIAN